LESSAGFTGDLVLLGGPAEEKPTEKSPEEEVEDHAAEEEPVAQVQLAEPEETRLACAPIRGGAGPAVQLGQLEAMGKKRMAKMGRVALEISSNRRTGITHCDRPAWNDMSQPSEPQAKVIQKT